MDSRQRHESSYAKCPFYRYEIDSDTRVVCEGLKPARTLSLKYPNKIVFVNYINHHCYSEYTQCGVYHLLCKQYEGDEKNG